MSSVRNKIAIASTSFGRCGGGVSAVALAHLRYLKEHSDIKGFAALSPDLLPDVSSENDIHLSPKKFSGKLSFFPSMCNDISRYKPDVVHQHGIWNYLSVIGNKLAKNNLPVVISPHGMLEKWIMQRKRFQKSLLSSLFQRKNILNAHVMHALTEAEVLDIRSYGYKGPIALIPNGVVIPKSQCELRMTNTLKVLYIGRLDEKKQVLELAIAVGSLATRGIPIELNIYGWGSEEYTKKLLAVIGNQKNVHFNGAVSGDEKERAFLASDVFVLPSKSEGLPMAILESWSYGLPCLMTDECNLSVGFERNASLRIESSIESIIQGLESILALSILDYKAMGNAGRELAVEKFNWTRVAKDLNSTYCWVVDGGTQPNCFVN